MGSWARGLFLFPQTRAILCPSLRKEPALNFPYLGETAALATALSWSFTAIFFTKASDRIGAITVNRTRLIMAVLLLALAHLFIFGSPLPAAGVREWLWLGLSGLIGLTIGDSFLFQSLVDIGPRKALLVMSSWPIFSALLAFALFGESLGIIEVAGVALTVSGIAWVTLEKSPRGPSENLRSAHPVRGISCATGGEACQATGLVFAKEGLSSGLSPLSGTLIRMIVAALGLWAVTIVVRRARESLGKLKDRRAVLFTFGGALTGPFFGVWMSLVAVNNTKVGVASSLMSLVPVLLIPLVRIFFGERVSWRAIIGTAVSFAGVLLLFLK
jgi:drug/metabolite transporter (DMT)-like permease